MDVEGEMLLSVTSWTEVIAFIFGTTRYISSILLIFFLLLLQLLAPLQLPSLLPSASSFSVSHRSTGSLSLSEECQRFFQSSLKVSTIHQTKWYFTLS